MRVLGSHWLCVLAWKAKLLGAFAAATLLFLLPVTADPLNDDRCVRFTEKLFVSTKSDLELVADVYVVQLLTDKKLREGLDDKIHAVLHECLIGFAQVQLSGTFGKPMITKSLVSLAQAASERRDYRAALAYVDRTKTIGNGLTVRGAVVRGDANMGLSRYDQALVDYQEAGDIWVSLNFDETKSVPPYISEKIATARAQARLQE